MCARQLEALCDTENVTNLSLTGREEFIASTLTVLILRLAQDAPQRVELTEVLPISP